MSHIRSLGDYLLQVYADANGLTAQDMGATAIRAAMSAGIRPESWTIAYDPHVHAYVWDEVNEELVAVEAAMLPFYKGDGEPCV